MVDRAPPEKLPVTPCMENAYKVAISDGHCAGWVQAELKRDLEQNMKPDHGKVGQKP